MSNRITDADIRRALGRYARALALHDVVAGSEVCVAAPYGQVMYVMRYDAEHRPVHDLPGFCGPVASGYTTKREVYDALMLVSMALEDLAQL